MTFTVEWLPSVLNDLADLWINEFVPVPLETTYLAAFDAIPEFWREVLTSLER